MGAELLVDSALPPGRRHSKLAYVSFLLAGGGWALIVFPEVLPLPTEGTLLVAGGAFVAAVVASMLVHQATLRTHRRPRNGKYAFFGVALSIIGFVGIVWAWGTQPEARPVGIHEPECREHLERIVGFYRRERDAGALPGERKGVMQLVLWMRKYAEGQEHLLVCPADLKYPYMREDRAVYHDDTRPEHEVRAKVSYVLRDLERFPVEGPPGEAWLVCCRMGLGSRTWTHGDGLLVGFADGNVRIVSREELGVGPDERIHAGVRAEHPELKKMLHVD
jgi:hypothetical protein